MLIQGEGFKGFRHIFHGYLDGEGVSCGRDERGVSLGVLGEQLVEDLTRGGGNAHGCETL